MWDNKWIPNQEVTIFMHIVFFATWNLKPGLHRCWDDDWRTVCLQQSFAPAPLPTLPTQKNKPGDDDGKSYWGMAEAHSPSGSPHSVHCDSKQGPKRDNRRLIEATHMWKSVCACVGGKKYRRPLYRNVNNCHQGSEMLSVKNKNNKTEQTTWRTPKLFSLIMSLRCGSHVRHNRNPATMHNMTISHVQQEKQNEKSYCFNSSLPCAIDAICQKFEHTNLGKKKCIDLWLHSIHFFNNSH